ncbi:uncharacterized protein TA03255 [Theileria annulata]|uniref:Uncharacterized protein n=1 Tax=Theileria annulata TaxID=5874 RepID=Q4UCP1_THEAN|nr:uncharacterized protein TA03255 [Theileria annulata]CAI75410.1 hypothetical protein TA03255 [Theileria annulata]|eukprot:XP_954886.1 hypothetical protein TA03255 [Theileria annulata]
MSDSVENTEDSNDNLIIRAYNVPSEYTISKFHDLIKENCSAAQLESIIPPQPWDDPVDTCWIIICKNSKTYKSLLALEDIWLKADKNDKFSPAVTFLPGQQHDLPHIPSKSDEQLLINQFTPT